MIEGIGIRIQAYSGVVDLTTEYRSRQLRNTIGRAGGQHEGTEAYTVTLSALARSIQQFQSIHAETLRGANFYRS